GKNHINSSTLAPAATLPAVDNEPAKPNPAFATYLTSTLFEPIWSLTIFIRLSFHLRLPFNKLKFIADSLAAINQLVSNNDLVSSVFKGYGPDYSMFVTAVINSPPLPNFPDLRPRLVTFEAQIKPDK
ncbi:hypothetical protein DVH24_035930, partial [Malus domestica]